MNAALVRRLSPIVCLALAGGAGAPPPVARAVTTAWAGPRERPAPAGAVVPATFEELASLVADPAGPAEIWLGPTTYRGDLLVSRPVALRGVGGSVLEGTGRGTVVTIRADDVVLENVSVRRSGRRNTTEDAGVRATGERVRISDVSVSDSLFGVSFQACRACILERASVRGDDDDGAFRGDGVKLWESHGSIVRGCEVDRVRDVVVWYTRRALVEGNAVRGSRYGMHFMYSHDSIARGNRLERDVVGIFAMYSLRLTIERNVLAGAHGAAGMGLGFKDSDAVRVTGNWLVADTAGVYLDDTPRSSADPVVFERNVFALNDVALRLHSAARGVAFRDNDFRDNGATIEVDGGGDALAADVRGNRFSDYEGYDLDADGTGDVPYRVVALSSDLAEAHPALRFFRGTAAMALVDAVARAVPLFEPRTLLVDPAPLVRAPEVSAP